MRHVSNYIGLGERALFRVKSENIEAMENRRGNHGEWHHFILEPLDDADEGDRYYVSEWFGEGAFFKLPEKMAENTIVEVLAEDPPEHRRTKFKSYRVRVYPFAKALIESGLVR